MTTKPEIKTPKEVTAVCPLCGQAFTKIQNAQKYCSYCKDKIYEYYQQKAVKKYNKANTISICVRLNKNTDSDIIDKLNDVPSKMGYIKELIRKDIEGEL